MDDNTFDLSEQLEEVDRPPVFTAMYPGECSSCGGDIDEGDSVRFNLFDEVIHAECDS